MFALYEDETIYSGFARLQKRLAVGRIELQSMFGFRKSVSPNFLPPGVSRLAADFFMQASVEQLRARHCISPFFKVTAGLRVADLAKLHGASALSKPSTLQLCIVCSTGDIQTTGETYWRRSHQLPGASVCWRHNRSLIASRASNSPTTNFALRDANDEWLALDETSPEAATSLPQFMLAVELRNLLNGHYRGEFRTRTLQAGFERKAGVPDFGKLESSINAFFGREYLETLGARLNPSDQGNWTRLLSSPKRRRSLHPTYHALFETFLKSEPHAQSVYATGPWRCPLPVDHGRDSYPVKTLQQRREKGVLVGRATCSCGTIFTTRGGQASRSAPLEISCVSEFGPQLTSKIRAALISGMSRKQVASTLKIPFNAVVRSQAALRAIGDIVT